MNKNILAAMSSSGPSSFAVKAVPARQRHGFLFVLFCLWLLSISFQRYDLVGSYSFDNLVAPALCLLAVALPRLRNAAIAHQRQKVLLVLIILYCLFWVSSVLPVLNLGQIALERGWFGLRDGFYLFAVALYVRDRWSFKVAKSLLVIVAMMAGVSTLLAALGWIHLPVERYEESRLGIAWLQKAVGLLSNYGDVAILYAFTATVLISHTRNDLVLGLGTWMGKLLAWFSLLAGLAGSQSRNVALAMMVAMGAYWLLRKLSQSRSAGRMAITGLLTSLGISVLGVLLVFGGDVINVLGSWGGTNAAQSANWRLDTDATALALIAEHPLTGITGDLYGKWGYLVDALHNTWLRAFLQGGLLRFAALLGLVWLAARAGLRNLRAERNTSRDAALVVATVVALLVATQFYGGQSEIMWMTLGMLVSFNWVSRDATQGKAR